MGPSWRPSRCPTDAPDYRTMNSLHIGWHCDNTKVSAQNVEALGRSTAWLCTRAHLWRPVRLMPFVKRPRLGTCTRAHDGVWSEPSRGCGMAAKNFDCRRRVSKRAEPRCGNKSAHVFTYLVALGAREYPTCTMSKTTEMWYEADKPTTLLPLIRTFAIGVLANLHETSHASLHIYRTVCISTHTRRTRRMDCTAAAHPTAQTMCTHKSSFASIDPFSSIARKEVGFPTQASMASSPNMVHVLVRSSPPTPPR